MDRVFYKWPLADTGPWFTMEIYKMYLWIKFVCLSVLGAALIPFSQKNIYFFVLCWGLITRWLLTLLLPPDPQMAIGCAGPWFFARCANLAFFFLWSAHVQIQTHYNDQTWKWLILNVLEDETKIKWSTVTEYFRWAFCNNWMIQTPARPVPPPKSQD
jgi:hypothetical protein